MQSRRVCQVLGQWGQHLTGQASGAGLLPNITPLLESLGLGSLCAVSAHKLQAADQSQPCRLFLALNLSDIQSKTCTNCCDLNHLFLALKPCLCLGSSGIEPL